MLAFNQPINNQWIITLGNRYIVITVYAVRECIKWKHNKMSFHQQFLCETDFNKIWYWNFKIRSSI
jgi:hypothetical protein